MTPAGAAPMRRLLKSALAAAAICLAGQGALALDDDALRELASRDDAGAFAAIGRLELGNGKFCTATLVTPQIVLTAGHCLYDVHTGARHDIADIVFQAGLRDGRPEAHRRARRAVVHPKYAYGETSLVDLAHDLALVELDHAVAPEVVVPLPLGQDPRMGGRIGVVSYQFDRSERPSLQEVCHVLNRQDGALITSCNVDFGASGAPILTFDDQARPALVSVVSAKAELGEQKVSIGTDLAQPFRVMQAELERGDGVFHKPAPKVLRMGAAEARSMGSAKFLKPGSGLSN
ncbi:trypsin-like serine peptidase [Palleronia pelagia]|nr:trypsin-like serine protease [Palleronia pelagia]